MATTEYPDEVAQAERRRDVIAQFIKTEVAPQRVSKGAKLTYGVMALLIILGAVAGTAIWPFNVIGVTALVLLALSWPR